MSAGERREGAVEQPPRGSAVETAEAPPAEAAPAEEGTPAAEGLDQALEAELGPAEGPEPAQAPAPDRPADPGEAVEDSAPGDQEGDPESAGGAEVSDAELEREIAALLFAGHEPLSTARLGSLLRGTPRKRVEAGLEALGRRLEASGLPYELRPIAGGWQLYTTPDMAETVGALTRARRDEKVSPAALETLAVVAYRQPVTKAEIEAIRGVQVGPILRTLVDRGLVRVTGRSPDPGHPLLYGTTRKFLDVFGLAGLDELPRDNELLRD